MIPRRSFASTLTHRLFHVKHFERGLSFRADRFFHSTVDVSRETSEHGRMMLERTSTIPDEGPTTKYQ